MPPFEGALPSSNGHLKRRVDTNIITIDVGGQLFQTTKHTLTQAGPKSLLSKLITNHLFTNNSVPFIDRDPELFSVLLSLLRTGNIPSKARSFDIEDLISEAKFYNIEALLIDSLSNPSLFEPFNLGKSILLPLNGRDSPSAISASSYGSVHVAHGCKITSFDWALQRKATIATPFSAIDSLLSISPSLAAAGATDFSGLQILDLDSGVCRESLNWENVTRSGSTVQAIGASQDRLFTSFESCRRNSNSIMVYDLNSLRPVINIAHNEIYGADIEFAIPATKLNWISSYNLLMAAGSHSGPSGVFGNIKLWDVRSGNVAWEVKEKVDCFSDVTVSESLSAIAKVGVNSGEVFMADLRSLGANANPWICLGNVRKTNSSKKEGVGCKIASQGNHVFSSKGGDLELWSEVLMGARNCEDGLEDRVFRRNLMGRVKDMGGCRITQLGFGGNKMFVTRKDQQSVEVWQSSLRGF